MLPPQGRSPPFSCRRDAGAPTGMRPRSAATQLAAGPAKCDTDGGAMALLEQQYDDAMFDFSRADYGAAIDKLRRLLEQQPDHFDARLALGMALYRQGDYAAAI